MKFTHRTCLSNAYFKRTNTFKKGESDVKRVVPFGKWSMGYPNLMCLATCLD
mgnify:CR=1 FL=1